MIGLNQSYNLLLARLMNEITIANYAPLIEYGDSNHLLGVTVRHVIRDASTLRIFLFQHRRSFSAKFEIISRSIVSGWLLCTCKSVIVVCVSLEHG